MNSIFMSLMIFLNVTLLIILVPGGPVENRDFSNLGGIVFWGFNVFLVCLGLSAFYATYAVLANLTYAGFLTRGVALGFIVVYAIDLAGIFPKSPTKMSKALMSFELINLSMGVYLFILSLFA